MVVRAVREPALGPGPAPIPYHAQQHPRLLPRPGCGPVVDGPVPVAIPVDLPAGLRDL